MTRLGWDVTVVTVVDLRVCTQVLGPMYGVTEDHCY